MNGNNRICSLLDIDYPIIQAGMVWCSGWKLASAVSNSGGLGVIGSGSMHPDVLKEHIIKCRAATDNPFAVNVPLMYPEIKTQMEIIAEHGVKVVITSAGNPKTWTPFLKENNIKVIHVISNSTFAKKSEEAGVDAVVAEGFEAGGHNGREETTTLCLIPLIRKTVSIPVIAAGGISTGGAMLAAMALGADGVQVGTRFAASKESSAHPAFKKMIINSTDGDTLLVLKKLMPVRLLKNDFLEKVLALESDGAADLELRDLLGQKRPKRGMFEGKIDEGEFEAGQVSALVDKIEPASEILKNIWDDYLKGGSEITKCLNHSL